MLASVIRYANDADWPDEAAGPPSAAYIGNSNPHAIFPAMVLISLLLFLSF